MKLYRTERRIVLELEGSCFPLPENESWDRLINPVE